MPDGDDSGITSLVDEVEASEPTMIATVCALRARIHWLRGQRPEALAMATRIQADLLSGDPAHGEHLALAARVRADAGDLEGARSLLRQVLDDDTPFQIVGSHTRDSVPSSLAAGELGLAQALLAGPISPFPVVEHQRLAGRALVAEAQGDLDHGALWFAEAARRWHAFGATAEEAFALLGHGRCLAGSGRLEEAGPPLREASASFARMGARPGLAEANALLAALDGGGPA